MHILYPISYLLCLSSGISFAAGASSCVAGDETCIDASQDEPIPSVFDVFATEGKKLFLDQILQPSKDVNKEESKQSFFDEMKDAYASDTQQNGDEKSLEFNLWNGISQIKDVVDGMDKSFNQFFGDVKSGIETERLKEDGGRDRGSSTNGDAFDFVKLFQSFFSTTSADKRSSEESKQMATDFIHRATQLTHLLQNEKAKRGVFELYDLVMKSLGEVTDTIVRNFGHIDWHRLKPFNVLYYLEYVESLFTPSWKRRAHVFAPQVSVKEVKELHKALYLANLSYMDTVDDIKAGLQEESSDWELIYAQLENAPGEPAHYIALRKEQPLSFGPLRHDNLDVLLVVRGTKDFSDVLSDGLLDAVEFRGGYGHAGVIKSGQFIADHHIDLFQSLLDVAKKDTIKLTLIGHSLGAGAASIAGMIFNEDEEIEVNVIGFGCPSLLSKKLSEAARDYVTTVVSDADMIPRLSGPTLVNAIFDIMSYNWVDKGLEDVRHGLEFVREKLPFDVPPEHTAKVYDFVKQLLDEHIKPEMEEISKSKREEVVLMPPGRCTHFYRDGQGITGQKVECSFFDSLEISRTMIDDHLIGVGYNRMLLDYMRHRLQDYQFTFEQKIV